MARYPRYVYQGKLRWDNTVLEPKSNTKSSLIAELREWIELLEADEAPMEATVSFGGTFYCEREHDDYYYGYSEPEVNNKLELRLEWAEEPTEEEVAAAKEAVDLKRKADKIKRDKAKKLADAKREKELRDLVKKNRAELEKLLKETE
jgi:uncharacterized protein YwqG